MKTNTGCGDPAALLVDGPVRYTDPGAGNLTNLSGNATGFDGPTMYVDPFEKVGNYQTVYMTGVATYDKGGVQTYGDPILRSTDGGKSWTSGASLPAVWHPAMTTTPSTGSGVHPEMLFVATCLNGHATVFWSLDGGITFPSSFDIEAAAKLNQLPSLPCASDTYLPTIAISRVAPVSEVYQQVRLAYQTGGAGTAGGDKTGTAKVAVVELNATLSQTLIGPAGVAHQTIQPIVAQDTANFSSISRLEFVQPDAFEWLNGHTLASLPDTTVLAWEESDLRCAPPSTKGQGTARYAVVRGANTWTSPQSLTGGKTWNSVGCRTPDNNTLGHDFAEGAFYYDTTSDSLNYVVPFEEPVSATDASYYTAVQHYNIVSIGSPPGLILITAVGLVPVASQMLLEVTVKGPPATDWSKVRLALFSQAQNGRWRRLGHAGNEDEDEGEDDSKPDCGTPALVTSTSTGATFRCRAKSALHSNRIIAMVRPADFVVPPHPPASACHPNIRALCTDAAFFASDLGCVPPAPGQPATRCVPAPGGAGFCRDVASGCASDGECCNGLSCLAGACTRLACSGERGLCATTSDCCGNLTCGAGACVRACRSVRESCSSTSNCCGGLRCDGGLCEAPTCGGERAACGASSDCCSSLVCAGGQCEPPTACAGLRATCSATADCCFGLACAGGSCVAPQCHFDGQPCASAIECCPGASCAAGLCTPGNH